MANNSKTLRILSYKPDFKNYQGAQGILDSDRVIINAKKDSIILSSNKTISISSTTSTNFDSDGPIIFNCKAIFLGNNATEPLLKGDQTVGLLSDILEDLKNICNVLKTLNGNPGSPYLELNSASSRFIEHLSEYKSRLQQITSSKNFTE